MKKIMIVFLSVTIFIMASTSREEYENKILYYETTIQNASDDYSLGQAVIEYNNFLTKDIDDTYKYLLSRANNRKTLKNSFIVTQEEWKKLRDAEFKFYNIAFENGGSWSGISSGMKKSQVLKSRLETLVNLIFVEGDITSIF